MLRERTERDLGLAAQCLLAFLGRDCIDDDNEFEQAFVGAILLAEGLQALKALATAPKEK